MNDLATMLGIQWESNLEDGRMVLVAGDPSTKLEIVVHDIYGRWGDKGDCGLELVLAAALVDIE